MRNSLSGEIVSPHLRLYQIVEETPEIEEHTPWQLQVEAADHTLEMEIAV